MNTYLDSSAEFSSFISQAVSWAEQQAREIASVGRPLTLNEFIVARQVGVMRADLIRVRLVSVIPQPTDPAVRYVARRVGLVGERTLGLTLGYGIYLRADQQFPWLLPHEFRHVYQYERAGSIAAYIPRYLQQVARYGYSNAPLEVDARAYEVLGQPRIEPQDPGSF